MQPWSEGNEWEAAIVSANSCQIQRAHVCVAMWFSKTLEEGSSHPKNNSQKQRLFRRTMAITNSDGEEARQCCGLARSSWMGSWLTPSPASPNSSWRVDWPWAQSHLDGGEGHMPQALTTPTAFSWINHLFNHLLRVCTLARCYGRLWEHRHELDGWVFPALTVLTFSREGET